MFSIIMDVALGAFVGVLIVMAMLSLVATAYSAIEWAKTHNYED